MTWGGFLCFGLAKGISIKALALLLWPNYKP